MAMGRRSASARLPKAMFWALISAIGDGISGGRGRGSGLGADMRAGGGSGMSMDDIGGGAKRPGASSQLSSAGADCWEGRVVSCGGVMTGAGMDASAGETMVRGMDSQTVGGSALKLARSEECMEGAAPAICLRRRLTQPKKPL